MVAPKAAASFFTRDRKKQPVPSANSKTPNLMDALSSSVKIANKVEDTVDTTAMEDTKIIAATLDSCMVNPLKRDANSLLAISPGKQDGGISKIISASAGKWIAQRLRKEVMEGRGDLVW